MYFISVQFSGTPKEYAYVSAAEPVLGQRVVVPTSIKKDGTIALSIATVVGFGQTAEGAKPVIALLDSALIAAAQEFVLKLEVPAA
jgi:hypothetical protein